MNGVYKGGSYMDITTTQRRCATRHYYYTHDMKGGTVGFRLNGVYRGAGAISMNVMWFRGGERGGLYARTYANYNVGFR